MEARLQAALSVVTTSVSRERHEWYQIQYRAFEFPCRTAIASAGSYKIPPRVGRGLSVHQCHSLCYLNFSLSDHIAANVMDVDAPEMLLV